MKKSWDGTDRRVEERRRDFKPKCALCDIIQSSTKEHREVVCAKIAEVKVNMEKKANHSDLRGAMKTIAILVGICIAVVAGQAVWLKSDISGITSSIQRLNIRITETVNDRVASDVQQLQKLGTIEGQLCNIGWRLTQIEEAHKPVNTFVPDGKNNRP